ncbi:hypothetical protein B5M42_005295 [Paenibacillus athensensis]|uniref:hypothetical protein n=1 Tax=Paenibacillus athensensis TaxID=1967502 RepID=UPI001431D97E|nr:hypothetical protein [Paenibacillus athensensis]MCD1258255.1 hypothetical protein [Paenibacillus athensensis]
MRQSIKHKAMMSAEQQLQQGGWPERQGQLPSFGDVEMSAEFTSEQERLKSIPKKTYR